MLPVRRRGRPRPCIIDLFGAGQKPPPPGLPGSEIPMSRVYLKPRWPLPGLRSAVKR